MARCSSQLRRAIILQPWYCAVDYHEVLVSFESGRHPQNSSVIRTRSEQQLSRTRCPGWMTNNSTTEMQWESQRGKNKNLPDSLNERWDSWA